MTDRHQSLHAECRRALGDQLERERPELPGLMQVDVDADPVSFGDPEHDVEMGHRVTVVRARIEAADEIGACPQRSFEQVRGTGVAEDAGLRERDHLHLDPPSVGLPRGEHSLQPFEAAVRVDLDVAPDRRGTGGDGGPQRRRRPLTDRCPRGTPVGAVVADQPGEPRLGGVGRNGRPRRGRVEVSMGIGERRQQHSTPALGHRHIRRRLATGDAAVANPDVDRAAARFAGPRPYVPQQQIPHLSHRSVQERPGASTMWCLQVRDQGEGPLSTRQESVAMTDTVVDLRDVSGGAGAVCRGLLDLLPDWFGIPEAVDDDVRVRGHPPVDHRARRRRRHRHHDRQAPQRLRRRGLPDGREPDLPPTGVGRAMLGHLERDLASRGIEFLQVRP